jgi:hypothetical protein
LIRWEKKPENYLAMIHLACATIVVKAIQVFGWALKARTKQGQFTNSTNWISSE